VIMTDKQIAGILAVTTVAILGALFLTLMA
jgi:hypothetical protein